MKKIAASLLSWFAVGCYWCVVTPVSKSNLAPAKAESIGRVDNPDISKLAAPTSTRTQPTSLSPPKTAKRLKIQVDVTRVEDLKVKEGQHVSINQLIADYRQPERAGLQAELDRVRLSIEQLKLAPKVKSIPPKQVKLAQGFSKPIYAEEEAAIASAKSRLAGVQHKYQLVQKLTTAILPETVKVRSFTNGVKEIEATIRIQEKKIEALKSIGADDAESDKFIDQPMQDHERVALSKHQQSLMEAKLRVQEAYSIEQVARAKRLNLVAEARIEIDNAQRDVDTAHARLAAAVEKTKQVRSDRQVAEIDREDRVFRTELERIKMIEVANLQNHDKEYQLAQLQLKKVQLEKQIREIKGILAPFDGTVRRVKLIAQQGNVLRYEVGIMYTTAGVQGKPDVSVWREDK